MRNAKGLLERSTGLFHSAAQGKSAELALATGCQRLVLHKPPASHKTGHPVCIAKVSFSRVSLSSSITKMKFPHGFEVQLARPNQGAAYREFIHGTDRYVVGVPGQPFEVKFSAPARQLVSSAISVSVEIDGVNAGLHKHLIKSRLSNTVQGFVTTVKGQHLMHQFVFGAAQTEAGNTGTTTDHNKVGRILVTFTAKELQPGPDHSTKTFQHHSRQTVSASEGDTTCAKRFHMYTVSSANSSTLRMAHELCFWRSCTNMFG